VVDDEGPIYVDGNSLRAPAARHRRAAQALVDEWGSRLVSGLAGLDRAARAVGDVLAEHVLGARSGEVLVCDSVTVNLFKLAGAVPRRRARPLVGLADDFPTDRYVLEGLARQHGVELRLVSREELPAAARDARLTVA
jgi:kynureninase